MKHNELLVVMPVYNEEFCINAVVDEWIPVLRESVKDFELLIVNDGSTDSTIEKLEELKLKHNEVSVLSHKNQGHGQSCLRGYELAIQNNVPWVFQIDSDGQCDPGYFKAIWAKRDQHEALYGSRWWRKDGLIRWLISWVVSLCVFAASKKWVRDPNVPYRLIKSKLLLGIIKKIPKDFYLANIAVSVLIAKKTEIYWHPIIFRKRLAGEPKVKFFQFAKHGAKLFKQLKQVQ